MISEIDKKKANLYLALLTMKNYNGVKLSKRNLSIVLTEDCYSIGFGISSADCLLLYILLRLTLSFSASLRDSKLRKVIMENAGTRTW